MKWLPIEELDMEDNLKVEVVVKAFNVKVYNTNYTSDPYCVFIRDRKFVRWPHHFPPTHFLVLPKMEKPNDSENTIIRQVEEDIRGEERNLGQRKVGV